jgi:hypothetical protein
MLSPLGSRAPWKRVNGFDLALMSKVKNTHVELRSAGHCEGKRRKSLCLDIIKPAKSIHHITIHLQWPAPFPPSIPHKVGRCVYMAPFLTTQNLTRFIWTTIFILHYLETVSFVALTKCLFNQKTRFEELGIWKYFSSCRYPFLGALLN